MCNSGRYDDFAKQLNVNGYKVYGMDWIGELSANFMHHPSASFLIDEPLINCSSELKNYVGLWASWKMES